MKRITLLVAPIVLISFAACNNGRAYNPDTRIETPQANQPVQTATATDTNPQTGQPVNANLQPITTSGAGLNPAHGQPGHRCDIAVGAPLNSAPTTAATQPAAPATNNSNPVTITPPTTQPAKTAAGLNPAHGQPGHRCDIAVGAPLDSKPAAAATTPATTQPATNKTSIPNPVAIQPQAAPQKVAPGMNPAHGQPGHRCDIAVGAPLDSKPAVATTPQQVSPLLPTPVSPLKPDSTKN